ncbi:MAG TPA: Rieske (2Fe-2S) protein [Pseudomonadales bacterium]|nr:Rieske (2Fe-2S) protein [Pseudomonadales bacterium]
MKLCRVEELAELASRGFQFDQRKVFVVKKNGTVFVYENACPHVGITLEFSPDNFLDYDKNFIICSGHGALFSIETGYCIAGPCRGKALRKVDYLIRDGWLEVSA